MLLDRLYTPGDDDVLYHYCSAMTLQAILASRRIRFTDINMLNDEQEARWGYSVFEEAATRLLNRRDIPTQVPKIDRPFIDSTDRFISPIQLLVHPFVACFSTEHDSLGQWRAYADDGRGFAIGIRAEMLKRLPVTLLRVEYRRDQQVDEMIRAIIATYLHRSEGAASDVDFALDCRLIATYMIAFKHHAFAYENEIRCVHAVNLRNDADRLCFVDPGGIASGKDIDGEPISFQVRANHLTAYLDLPLSADDFLAEVILGPKNESMPGNIQLFLGACDLPMTRLRRSEVPYR
jgi:hypothetical protein